jgi:predicted RNase H-like HicB family nuclease
VRKSPRIVVLALQSFRQVSRPAEKKGNKLKNYKISAVVWYEPEGYVSVCPELGVASAGEDREDALKNLKEAVELYIENAEILGLLPDIEPALESEDRYSTLLEVSA